jgi:tetratricopeptide (TPR) repeat protein
MFECRVRLLPVDEHSPRDPVPLASDPLCGLFLPGGDVAKWIDLACRWTDHQHSIRFYPCLMPASSESADGRIFSGAFVVLRRRPDALFGTFPAIKFRQASARLWIPADARFEPSVDAELLEQSLTVQAGRSVHIAFWHPAQGLMTFIEDDGWPLERFFHSPAIRMVPWDMARPAVHFPQRLTAVRAGRRPNWEAGDRPPDASLDTPPALVDLGTKAAHLSDLPPTADEQRQRRWPRRVATVIRRSALRILQRFANRLLRAVRGIRPASSVQRGAHAGQPAQPTGPAGRSAAARGMTGGGAPKGWGVDWLTQLRDWTQRRLAADDDKLADKRQREVQRLLSLLQSNPDQGLDYAIPLANHTSGRGVSVPTSELFAQRLDDRLYAGAFVATAATVGDDWTISAELRRQLEAKYRELANREMTLRRYRRAANLYAGLLGDWDAAAKALEAGGHFRDAGELLRDRLQLTEAAAECFRRGGLFEEALETWRKIKRHREAADILRVLGREPEAILEYRLAVKQLSLQSNPVEASTILAERLGEPDEALELLARSWPYGTAARACFERRLKLLQSLGRTDALLGFLRQLRDDPAMERLGLWPLEAIAQLVKNQPVAEIRDTAEDVVRVVAGRQLATALHPSHSPQQVFVPHEFVAMAGQPSIAISNREVQSLLSIVAGLSTGDRLLERDCQRFGDRLQSMLPRREWAKRPAAVDRDGATELFPEVGRWIYANVEWCWAARLPLDPTSVSAIARDEANELSIVHWPLPVENGGGAAAALQPLRLPRTSAKPRIVMRMEHARTRTTTLLVLDHDAAASGAVSPAGTIESDNSFSCSTETGNALRVVRTTPGVYDFASGPHGHLALIGVPNDVVLKRFGLAGELRQSMSLALRFHGDKSRAVDRSLADGVALSAIWPTTPVAAADHGRDTHSVWRVAEAGRWFCVAHGRRCVFLSDSLAVRSEHSFAAEVHSLAVSRAHSGTRICFSLSQGAVLQWLEDKRWRAAPVQESMATPLARFLPCGMLVLAANGAIEVYDPSGNKTRCVRRGQFTGEPVALVALSNRQFAVLTRDGNWLRYSI